MRSNANRPMLLFQFVYHYVVSMETKTNLSQKQYTQKPTAIKGRISMGIVLSWAGRVTAR
jgi:hypothetical protein